MSRVKLAALRQKAAAQAEVTRQVKAEVEAKREERKVTQSVAQPLVLEPTAPKPKAVTATQVEAWFKEGLCELYGPTFIVAKWTLKDKALGKRLLSEYGADLVQKAIKSYCQDWDQLVKRSRGRLNGTPTLGLFWAMRNEIFGSVQVGKRQVAAKNSDEYTDDGSPDAGW
jgi:hypothetical protein